jgi:hypothetical protein
MWIYINCLLPSSKFSKILRVEFIPPIHKFSSNKKRRTKKTFFLFLKKNKNEIEIFYDVKNEWMESLFEQLVMKYT